VWRGDGKELFYVNAQRFVHGVPVGAIPDGVLSSHTPADSLRGNERRRLPSRSLSASEKVSVRDSASV